VSAKNSGSSDLIGIRWGQVTPHADERGVFREAWRASSFLDVTPEATGTVGSSFVQANISYSKAGVLRGLHYHRRQLDHWVVADGEVFVALVDLRSTSVPPPVVVRTLGVDQTVTIPVLVAHGFLALRPTTLLYFVTTEYDATDEHGLAWDDPEVHVAWPRVLTSDGMPIISARDRRNPSLADIRRSMSQPA
jgi:dTDP-4-dehydrorhamnose 3,5-epimerase